MAAKEAAVITTEMVTQEAVAAVTTADRLAETEVRDAITAAKADTLAANANNRRESADPKAVREEAVAVAVAEGSTPVSVITADRRDTWVGTVTNRRKIAEPRVATTAALTNTWAATAESRAKRGQRRASIATKSDTSAPTALTNVANADPITADANVTNDLVAADQHFSLTIRAFISIITQYFGHLFWILLSISLLFYSIKKRFIWREVKKKKNI